LPAPARAPPAHRPRRVGAAAPRGPDRARQAGPATRPAERRRAGRPSPAVDRRGASRLRRGAGVAGPVTGCAKVRSMALKKVDTIWIDGELVPWDDANEHVLAHTLHYGVGAFEGIRAYEVSGGKTAIFRLREHIDRLFESCHIATLDIPHSREKLMEACREVVRVNGLRTAYLRPLVYMGYGALGLGSKEAPVKTVVAAYEWGAYLGEEGLRRGIRCKVSGFRRGGIDSFLSKGKICGQYVTSVLAKRDALASGFDE